MITGVAGLIGMHAARRVLASGRSVIGIDNLNDYYPVQLKRDQLTAIQDSEGSANFAFHEIDFSDHAAIDGALNGSQIEAIVHLE